MFAKQYTNTGTRNNAKQYKQAHKQYLLNKTHTEAHETMSARQYTNTDT